VHSTTRTAEQTEIALFWVEGAPQGWNRIARIVSIQHGLDLWQNARLFGLLNFASADGYIADFETKYFYKFWRPISAIRAADSDGNPDTLADPMWNSLRVTPPAPDHSSGHSVEGGAMSEVLARFFGTARSASVLPARRSRESPVRSRASPKRRKKTATRASTSVSLPARSYRGD
jgi:hypothetical protein